MGLLQLMRWVCQNILVIRQVECNLFFFSFELRSGCGRPLVHHFFYEKACVSIIVVDSFVKLCTITVFLSTECTISFHFNKVSFLKKKPFCFCAFQNLVLLWFQLHDLNISIKIKNYIEIIKNCIIFFINFLLFRFMIYIMKYELYWDFLLVKE